jgi:putative acetyltransferase
MQTTESDTSTVILIGGIGCTGKTLLASQLMKKTSIPYFPLDHLMMGIYRGMPDCGFTPMDGQFVLGEKIWPVIKGVIMTNIENDHNIILEGFQLLPHLLKDFPSEYLEKILPVFLFFSEQYIQDSFDTQILKYRSAIESRSDIDDITIEGLIGDTKRLKEQCIENEVTFFEIEDDYDTEMMVVQDFVLTKLGVV